MGLISTGIKAGVAYAVINKGMKVYQANEDKKQSALNNNMANHVSYPDQQNGQQLFIRDAPNTSHQSYCNGQCGGQCTGAIRSRSGSPQPMQFVDLPRYNREKEMGQNRVMTVEDEKEGGAAFAAVNQPEYMKKY